MRSSCAQHAVSPQRDPPAVLADMSEEFRQLRERQIDHGVIEQGSNMSMSKSVAMSSVTFAASFKSAAPRFADRRVVGR